MGYEPAPFQGHNSVAVVTMDETSIQHILIHRACANMRGAGAHRACAEAERWDAGVRAPSAARKSRRCTLTAAGSSASGRSLA